MAQYYRVLMLLLLLLLPWPLGSLWNSNVQHHTLSSFLLCNVVYLAQPDRGISKRMGYGTLVRLW